MSEYILIGKLVNTHGIKGEVKILSDFTKKDLVFKSNFTLYLGRNKMPLTITGYRKHKIFDMVTFEGICNINQVLDYKGMEVFVKKSDLLLEKGDYLLEDLIGLEVIEDNICLGKIVNLLYNNGNTLLEVVKDKSFYIPINGDFIKKVDLENKVVETKNAKGLIL